MKKNNFYYKIPKKFFVILIMVFFLILFAFLIIDGYFDLERDIEIKGASLKDMSDKMVSDLFSQINLFDVNTKEDLKFITQLSSLNNFLKNGENIEFLENDFLIFLKRNDAYYQLRYIDQNGQEVVRVENDNNGNFKIDRENLQFKGDMNYFIETIKLDKNEVYLSNINVNVENGIVENKGTKENPIYVPVIRFSMPLFNENYERKGIIILNFYADSFLEEIRRSNRNNEKFFLIRTNGEYLANEDRTKEFSSQLNTDYNFYKDYPEINPNVLTDKNEKHFETNENIFSYKNIFYYFEINSFDKTPKDNQWILVKVLNKKELNRSLEKLKTKYIYFLIFITIVILIILFLFFISINKYPGEKK